MSKKIISSFLIATFFFFIVNPSVFADGGFVYSKEIRNQIIENFKKDQYDYIFSNDDNILLKDESVNFLETTNKIEFYERLKSSAEQKSAQLGFKNKLIDLKAKTLQEAIDELDSEIESKNNEIVSIENDIEKLSKDIINAKAEIVDLQNQVNENNKILLEYIAYIYKKANNIKGDDEIDSLKIILMNTDNLNQVLSEIYYSSLIEVTGQALIEQHRGLIKKTFLKKISLENTQTKLENEKQNQIIRKKEITEKKLFREKLLTYTKGQQSLYEEYLSKQKEVERNLKLKIIQGKLKIEIQKNNLLKQYNCENLENSDFENIDGLEFGEEDLVTGTGVLNKKDENKLKCENLSRILENELKLQTTIKTSTGTNIFSWPIEPTRGISAYYKDPDYKKVVGAEHDAIDIRAYQGTDIKAPADGYVTFLRAPNDSGYAYVAIKHANGFVSVYGHINELYVDKFDYIKKGEVFAKSGGEFGTNGAGPMTSGPHLHMELFKDKQVVDPLDYMDLTILGEENIPVVQKYVYKYIDDFREKTGGEEYEGELTKKVKIFKLEGETEIDRQKDLLLKYAAPDFKNWDMWVEEAVYGDIDPSFLMCVGLAETGLGRNLKTGYNVGNIGNTDSGSTMVFPNARSGIYWMVKTLNNRFLGNYETMNLLSRYGNKDKPIYASSPINWQTNVKRCLTALKKETIPDDFKFRTKKD